MSNDSPPSPPSPTLRRASYAPGQKLTELFGRSPTTAGGSSAYPGPIAAAAANAHAHQRRRMSVSTLGLSGSPNQTSPFTATQPRKESNSSSASTSPSMGPDESCAIDESEGPAGGGAAPGSPFSRRVSFGARAMRDARSAGAGSGRHHHSSSAFAVGGALAERPEPSDGSPFDGGTGVDGNRPPPPPPAASGSGGGGGGRPSASALTSAIERKRLSNSISRAGEGFNWSDQMRSKAERTSSVSSPVVATSPSSGRPLPVVPAPPEPPVREMPKQPRAPDHFQERILKGDFYMD